ncbi:hypothetical protein [Streptomyces asiaticus]|uniref:hypothetical protein n=1 Tax=Streptomyces asiaticus TaxID=114695 RepID=UPI003F668111
MTIQRIRHCFLIGELTPVAAEQLRVRSAHIPRGEEALDGAMTIEALPTWYSGTTFRSKLEADWAATLDSLSIRWEYEPETITLPSGAVYIPDFWLPDIGTWLEVKGTGVPRVEKAIELGETLACRCDGDCTCEWPGGKLVLIGHPPERYNPWPDHEGDDSSYWRVLRRSWRHHGHPNWSSAHGRAAWLTRCQRCDRGTWFTRPYCRACGIRLIGAHGYRSGDAELEFIDADCLPAPIGEAA